MTELLLGARDQAPVVCGCCSRLASSVGVIHPPGQHVLWLCALCSPANGMKVADMNPTKLVEVEDKAISSAAETTIEAVADAIFTQLWAHGVRDLEAISPDLYKTILADVSKSGEYRQAIRDTFLTYSTRVRTDLTNEKA